MQLCFKVSIPVAKGVQMSAWNHTLQQHSSWFATLTKAQQQQLLAGASMIQLAQGSRLFARGDNFDGIYVVLSGAVLISGLHAGGKEALLTIVSCGDWFGEIALFDQQSRTHDATASTASTLFHLPASFLQTLLTQQPLWWQLFGRLLTEKVRLVFQALEDISLQPAKVRLARRLLMLCRLQGQQPQYQIPIQQEQLGQLLSLSRQTTNQLLQQLAQQGVVRLAYASIEVIDPQLLQQLASAD